MDLLLSDDQRAIVASVAEVLDDRLPMERVRHVLDGFGEPLAGLWRSAADAGWFGLGLAESYGGTGFDLIDEALLFKELGRRATPGPFLATTLAARVAAVGGAADLAAQLLAGDLRAGLAIRGDDEVRLIGAVGTQHLLLIDDAGAHLFVGAAALDRNEVAGLDELTSREVAVLTGDPIVSVSADVEPIAARGSVLVSAMLAGIADAVCSLAVGYAKTREQFGSPIGAFQAVKHRCADMAVGASLADAQLTFAALSVGEGAADAAYQAAAARVVAERAALDNARETIQIYGGIGVTWECDAHLYLKRVHALRELFGGEAAQRSVLLAAT
ncbi:MAG TPA: acyl-CoA dehydrogenase family protein [Mycobacteriales bacterium]|jgi:alkylation response protein AidB-like acyl-CoA dehydrogenase|nr:acyl-CoA dehydrogenase family protein [Mycobacteriales bacterium]